MTPSDIQTVLDKLVLEAFQDDTWGSPAKYIPELACIQPDQFAISVALACGKTLSAGASEMQFSIQSISKVFTLSLALGRCGDALWARVGREASGSSFDSIALLELEKGRPRNPFINAGAIVTTDSLLEGHAPKETLSEILRFVRVMADDQNIHINPDVASSEKATGHRNFSLAYYLQSHENLRNDPTMTMGTYFHQCAIEMSTRQLAQAGRYLANIGPRNSPISRDKIRRINAIMMTCGLYDESGDFAFRVGLPSKSGVGGGVLLIVPGRASIAIWSPGLNGYGNSKAAIIAAQRLSTRLGWSVF
jgi:glutaminase